MVCSTDRERFVLIQYVQGPAILLNVRNGNTFLVENEQKKKEIVEVFTQAGVELSLRKSEGRRLRIMHLHLTARCNWHCKHCYIDYTRGIEMPTNTVFNLLKQASEVGVQRVSITGGEPFLKEDLETIVKKINDYEMHLYPIFTNGTLIEKNLHIIRNILANYVTAFYISLHGLKSSHEYFSEAPASYEKVISAIKTLHDMGANVVVNTTLNKYNIGEMHALYALLKSLKVKRWRISKPFLAIRWKNNCSDMAVSTKQELELYNRLLKSYIREVPFDLELGNVFKFIDGAVVKQEYSLNDASCGYYSDSIVVWPNGDISPCHKLYHSEFISGNIYMKNLKAIWESSHMTTYKNLKIADLMRNRNSCKECYNRLDCVRLFGAGCYANAFLSSNKENEIDPETCETMKHKKLVTKIINLNCEFYKKRELQKINVGCEEKLWKKFE
jgi:radical SAM protein with 4Fe4S-binding SPASM domain